MHRPLIFYLCASVMIMAGGANDAHAFNWPWSKKPERRKSYELYPQPDQKSARKIKKARKKKSSELAKKRKAQGTYKP